MVERGSIVGREAAGYLQCFSWKRLFNGIKLYASFLVSRLARRSIHWGKPLAISVEPTSVCNLHCPECPTGAGTLNRAKGSIDIQSYKEILTGFSPHLAYVNLYLQGEPFLFSHFPSLVREASLLNIYSVTSTNGQVFSRRLAQQLIEAGLKRLIFSVDGLSQSTYEKYRVGGELAKVVNAIRIMVAVKKEMKVKHPFLVAQFIVFEHNEHEVGAFPAFARELGVDKVEIKSAQFNDFGNGTVHPPHQSRFRRYGTNDGVFFSKRGSNHCWKQWISAVFTWEGEMLPCCYDKDSDYVLGRVGDSDVVEIWKGKKAQAFRSSVLKNRNEINICANCPEGRT
ncbi:radical SAM protein [Marinilabiliaceae bacterium JC017]|nr:radical SAM protein [Marinilabiliaceae bacterium JC017]